MANTDQKSQPGPAIRAVDPWLPGKPSEGKYRQLLSNDERARLATLATIVRFKKGETIYSQGQPVNTIFNIISGIVKAYSTDKDEHIKAFLYPQDLFGLSEEGRYSNSAIAVTPVTAYALPIPVLRRKLSKDAELEFHVITKLCHELRQAQRHALLLAQRHALVKLAMFLQLQEHLQSNGSQPANEIYLPMSRKDIAEFVGMSLPAVSRGLRDLTERRIIRNRDRRHIKIIDRKALEKLANGQARGPS